jgi:hypothetical protein
VSPERRTQAFQLIDCQVKIGDAEAANENRLAEVQADGAVGTPAEGQVARPKGAPDPNGTPPAVWPGDVPAHDVGEPYLGAEEPETRRETLTVEPNGRGARDHPEQEEDGP